jgi:aminopeptidase N
MKSASSTMNLAVNPNTQNYDITYHKLEFTVDPAVYFITGKVTTTFTAKADMNTVYFDFYKKTTGAFTIASVKMNGMSLTFVHSATHELIITLPTTLTTGSSATVEISYSGAPSLIEAAFTTSTRPGSTQKVLYTLSEPYGARDWWPCKQDLNDKVDSIDVYITAPSQYITVSNGVEPVEPGYPLIVGSNKTTHFHHGHPIPAYLIAIAATQYTIYNQVAGLGSALSPSFPIINYLYPENLASNQTKLNVTPDILNFYETIIGPYGFRDEKYGHAQFGWGGGMEHTTVTFMGSFGRELISHEMAHQWFGDKITCGSWKDIWLNEGITEYMSGCTVEHFDGDAAFINWKTNKVTNITSQPTGNLYLNDSQINSVARIFDSRITYNKGSMVSNMLRYKLGDAVFFQALREYLSDPMFAYKYAVTDQFRIKLEQVSGVSLTEFFNDWIYNQGYPTYTINAYNSAPGKATVQVSQTQSDPSVSFFESKVPLRFLSSTGAVYDTFIDNTYEGQIAIIDVPFVITSVIYDPKSEIISANNFATLSNQNFDYDSALNVYPNPSSDFLNIDVPEDISLSKTIFYNNLGQKSFESDSNKINISELSNGIYFLEIETSKAVIHKKFIKK